MNADAKHLATREERARDVANYVQSDAVSLMDAIRQAATDPNVDVAKIKALYELHEMAQESGARRAFAVAMAEAKAEMPVIIKNREVDYTSAKGRTHYRHEDLAEIARVISPILGKHGLSYRFRTTSNPNEPVTVTCIVSHRLGYSEENTLTAGKDDSGNKNSIQAVGSTLTYLQRMTLKAALGLAASHDDDGRGSEPIECISDEQVKNLRKMVSDFDANEQKIANFAKVQTLEEIPVQDFDRVVGALNAWARAQRSK